MSRILSRGGGVHPSRQTPLPAADTEQTPPGDTPVGRQPPPPPTKTATAADGMHPTGMHFYYADTFDLLSGLLNWLHREKGFIFPGSCSRLIRLLRV